MSRIRLTTGLRGTRCIVAAAAVVPAFAHGGFDHIRGTVARVAKNGNVDVKLDSNTGMGAVYRARDTRLNRTVAIKVLPGHFADQPEVRQRFEREAHAISSLNHPNILRAL